ncbi:transposase [Candidatus Symbiothrix dinenymphae]|nr:transposase [Candidatus Symbiothrix dinenymphae]
MCIGMKVNKNLIGNLAILLAERCKPLSHTKLLKLLYLIDEEAVKRIAVPVTWLSYNVWQYGPVSEDIYFSKMEGYNKLSEFVRFDTLPDNTVVITPIAEFSNAEFYEDYLEIIDDVVAQYGNIINALNICV